MLRCFTAFTLGLAVIGFASQANAQFPSTNPLPGSVPKSDLRFRLEKVIQIPNFGNSPPRPELLTFAGDDGNLFVNDQHGDLYRFELGDTRPTRIADFAQLVDATRLAHRGRIALDVTSWWPQFVVVASSRRNAQHERSRENGEKGGQAP